MWRRKLQSPEEAKDTKETPAVDMPQHKHVHWMRSPHAQGILGFLSFSESVCAPIITDPFLVAIILTDRARWLRYTIITIITSVLGGLAAYFLGALFFEVFGLWLLDTFSLHTLFIESTQNISGAGFWFIFLGALTPIPYKLVALVGGFVWLPLWSFVLASLIGRSIRFLITGYLAYWFGPMALELFRYRLNVLYALVILAVLAYTVYKFVG